MKTRMTLIVVFFICIIIISTSSIHAVPLVEYQLPLDDTAEISVLNSKELKRQKELENKLDIKWGPPVDGRIFDPIRVASEHFEFNRSEVYFVCIVESHCDPDVERIVNGPVCPMQIMPWMAYEIGKRQGIKNFSLDMLDDLYTCVRFGAWLLRDNIDSYGRFSGYNRNLAVASGGYNGGIDGLDLLTSQINSFQPGGACSKKYRLQSEQHACWVVGMMLDRDKEHSATYDDFRSVR